MADVESSSSAMQQRPTSTSSHMSSIPLLAADDILGEEGAELTVELQQQQQQQQQQLPAVGSVEENTGGGNAMMGNLLQTTTADGPNVMVLDPLQLSTQQVEAPVTASSSAGPTLPNAEADPDEPPAKKVMLEVPSTSNVALQERLEYRLGGILCCSVCLDLTKSAMYQCQMGHLMCGACFTHLLADGRLRDQVATCPNCRVEISKSTASRNLAVEKASSELPSECQFCSTEFPYKFLERHEQQTCVKRPTMCKYSRIGCDWFGPNVQLDEHERNCVYPNKSGLDVMTFLEEHDANLEEERKVFHTLIDLLSYEKIVFNDLQLKPYRTDEYLHKLFYETARFAAFNQQWVVKARINNSQRDPHQSNERSITFQLVLKTKTSAPLSIHFFALKGPFSDMKLLTKIYKYDFTDQSTDSEYYALPLPDSSECNRALSNRAINIRLLMFMLNK